MLSEDQKKAGRDLMKTLQNEIMPALVAIHHQKSEEDCKMRVMEELATIGSLIMTGHLILKHKEGETTDDIIKKFELEDSKENSSPSSKRFENEG